MISLRPVTPGDTGFLREVYTSTRWEELAVTNWTEEQKREFCLSQFAAQDAYYRQYYPEARFDVILFDGIPSGRLYVDRWKREIRIMDIALLPKFRGRGIGTWLLRSLLEEAAQSGKSLSIHVERMNPALRLYQRLGFRIVEDKGIYLLLEAGPSQSNQIEKAEACH